MNIYFRKSDSRTDDGQKNYYYGQKNYIGGIAEPKLTTVNRKKIIRGITKADLMTVNGQKNYRGRQKPSGGQKSGDQKKVATKNVGY